MNKQIRTILAGSLLSLAATTVQAAALIDFSVSSGTLSNGIGYSLSGGWAADGSSAVRLDEQSVTITFDQAVSFELLPSDPSSGTGVHNDDNGERINATSVGGSWSLLGNPDGEIKDISGLLTDNLQFFFEYRIDGDTGPNNNDYLAVQQDWGFSGYTTSTLTLTNTNGSASGLSVNVFDNNTNVPLPGTLTLMLGALLVHRQRLKRENAA